MTKARWTILTYIAAHNNLADAGRASLNQILKVGSTTNVVHGMLYDGPATGGRYVVGDAGYVAEQEGFEEFDSGDPDALIGTAQWLFEKHPAERYGLVLWSHGTGWTPDEIAAVATEVRPEAATDSEARERADSPGSYALFRTTLRTLQRPRSRAERAILFDDGTAHSLDTLELRRVMSAIGGAVGQPIDFLGMDACLMGSLEVAYELKATVRGFVASSEMVPFHSWPYPAIYGALRDQPEMTSTDLARLVVEQYSQFYTDNPPHNGDVTKVALDLGKVDALATTARQLADALLTDMANHTAVIWDVQRAAKTRETSGGKRAPSKFDYHLWDLGSLVGGLGGHANASVAVRDASSGVAKVLEPGVGVLAERHRGTWFDGTRGLSVYLMPPGAQRLSPSYGQLAFAQQTHWLDMLTKYHELA